MTKKRDTVGLTGRVSSGEPGSPDFPAMQNMFPANLNVEPGGDFGHENPQSPSETARIRNLAQAWAVPPILSGRDLPTQNVIQDEALCEWMCRDMGDTLCIMEDQSIITSQPDSLDVEAARKMMALRGLSPKIRPALSEIVRGMRRTLQGSEAQIGEALNEFMEQTETNVSRLLESILDAAISRNASDIHLELREQSCNIRFRLNGQMVLYDQISARETLALGNYMFNAEAKRGALQFLTHMPLNGTMETEINGEKIVLRMSTAPDIRGVDIYLRIWQPNVQGLTLHELGYTPLQVALLSEAVIRPYGVIVISGPTGSGKSTTLSAVLESMDSETKIVSLEAPVERTLPNVTHVAVSAIAEHGGWQSLRSGLNRWDSDVNMVGEVKDQETAEAIEDLVTSGKLTMTTLHASNVLAIPARLEDLGVTHTMLCDPYFLVMLINQRLIPKLCPNCRVPYAAAAALDEPTRLRYDRMFGDQAENVFLRGPGCSQCDEAGVIGRVLVAEMVVIDDISREFIRDRVPDRWREYLMKQGWHPIQDHAFSHLYAGSVDPRMVEQMIGRFGVANDRSFDYAEHEDMYGKTGPWR